MLTFGPLCPRLALEGDLNLLDATRLGEVEREQAPEKRGRNVVSHGGSSPTVVLARDGAAKEDDRLSERNVEPVLDH